MAQEAVGLRLSNFCCFAVMQLESHSFSFHSEADPLVGAMTSKWGS